MIVVPNVGEIELLKRMFGQGIDGGGVLKLGLIDEDLAITELTTLAELEAIEVNTDSGDTGGGGEDNYARISLTDSLWEVSISGDGIATYPQVTFTLNGSGDGDAYNVYGYFVVVEGTTDQLLWAEKFSSALSIAITGGQISITLKLELD